MPIHAQNPAAKPTTYTVEIYLIGVARPMTFTNVAAHIVNILSTTMIEPDTILTLPGADGRRTRIRAASIAAVHDRPTP